MLRLTCVLALPFLISAQPSAPRVDALLNGSTSARQAFWGIRIVDLETGAPVYSLNEDRFFIPASNTKLFSTSLALMRLGPDYIFHTRVLAPAAPDSAG